MDIFTKGIVWKKSVDLAKLDLLFANLNTGKFKLAPHYLCLKTDAPAVP